MLRTKLGCRAAGIAGVMGVVVSLIPVPGVYAAESCTPIIARVVSIQGSVELRRGSAGTRETGWQAAELNGALCAGDSVRTHERSRAALLLGNETTLRLDQRTTLTLAAPDADKASLMSLVGGALHVITRTARPFRVSTPFVNANVEGTEFLVNVAAEIASVTVYEGRVAASNERGSVSIGRGERAVAARDSAPRKEVVVRPRDAVQWTLYFPTVFDYRLGAGAPADRAVRESIDLYRKGNLAGALDALANAPESARDARFLVYRAGLLLLVGRVDEARPDIERALTLDPRSSDAYSLQAVIAVVENDNERALTLANKAVELDPSSPAARIALSYALQARFKIDEARESARKAVELDPRNALAWARLAELDMSMGYTDRALDAAKQATALDPELAKTQTVLGFVYLARIDTKAANAAFEKAIGFDQADPLPRLGLGLGKIREGDLEGGREEIEIATSLDPETSLLRSYLGKAYYEEKRDSLAGAQFGLAKELDPSDPTPWFYDAILLQSINRPVEALEDLQKSIELNDNRAVYRSRLLLDEDQAARTVAQARVFTDLGFDRLALTLGAESATADQASSAAHRLLADTYVDLPRHEIARVSELLQSQLLQPLTMTPTQLQLSDEKFVALRGAGPAQTAFNEFNALFNRNGAGIQASFVGGGNSTFGDQVLLSGIQDHWGYSIGQLYYKTDGFRENDDYRNEIYDGFLQYQASEALGIQGEVRHTTTGEGDTVLRFDPLLFFPDRNHADSTSYRVGAHVQFNPGSDLLASFIAVDSNFTNGQSGTTIVDQSFHTYIGEAQYIWRRDAFSLIVGGGAYSEKTDTTFFDVESSSRPTAANAYAYGNFRMLGDALQLLLGVSVDRLNATDELGGSKTQTNPKAGVIWSLTPATTLRAAYFRTLKRRFFANPTLEPTQVAGFNQFFDDLNGTDATGAGVALDQKFTNSIFGGVEAERRNLKVPQDLANNEIFNWTERAASAYLYWAANPMLALSARFGYERFERPPDFPGQELFTQVTTRTVPLLIDFHHPNGFLASLSATYVWQNGMFYSSSGDPDPQPGSSRFWVADLAIGYRLPRRLGMVSLEVRNLFDKTFQFQETDLFSPVFAPHRVVLARATLSF
jgi:tetratricopeptide (TPR) repeat protein